MDKIYFKKNESTLYHGTLYTVTQNIIRIIFEDSVPADDILISGFYVKNWYNDELQGNFSEYVTIYRKYQDDHQTIELSNDGSVHKEIIPDPDEPYTPTFAEIKSQKISQLSNSCKNEIESGIDINIDNNTEHFSYSISNGDQSNIDDIANAALTTKLGQSYHCDGGDCKIYTLDQIVAIYVGQKYNKMHHITYFNQMKQYINSFTNENDIDMIKQISYGDELSGKYLATYNLNMENSKNVIIATLKAYGINTSPFE